MSATGPAREIGRAGPHFAGALVYGAAAVVLLLLLVATARPIATDDLWWHLGLGRAFARQGPWLASDPLLFTATRPPSSASWLADVALATVFDRLGFAGLRIAHALVAAAILAFAGALLRREAGSRRAAALAWIAFATLAAYRVFQLRPELATLLATLLLYAFVLRERAGPTPARIALGALGFALWANLHAGFLLGPILVAAALFGATGGALFARPSAIERQRMRRLLLFLVVGALTTTATPSGIAPHLAYFAAGGESPALSAIGDEWARFAPFTWPAANAAPTRAEWLCVWALFLATLGVTTSAAVTVRRRAKSLALDPALVALAWAALAAMAIAVRFLWLGIFPLLLLCQAGSAPQSTPRAATLRRWLPAVLGPALLAGFAWLGPWPRISDVLRPSADAFAQPYAAEKYPVEAIWLLRDAGLKGRLFTDYTIGGFAGFWLAPQIRTFVNGSLNSGSDTMDVYFAILRRRAVVDGESFTALLDRLGIQIFLGTGWPKGPPYSVAHLERTPGWLPIFRNASSALYLREDAVANLQRVADYYARTGVPFDRERGFDPARVIREQPDWAVAHRMIPATFASLEQQAARDDGSPQRVPALIETALFHALLGSYEAALERESHLRALEPLAVGPRRRAIWCLLRAGSHDGARAEAEALASHATDDDKLLLDTLKVAHSLPRLSTEVAESLIRRLPLLTATQAQSLGGRLERPVARTH